MASFALTLPPAMTRLKIPSLGMMRSPVAFLMAKSLLRSLSLSF
ncbi:MAG: hypothetical protein ACYCYR_02925 [Desulfobulbaceae bacterium]